MDQRTTRIAGRTLLPICAAGLFVAMESAAQTPSDPAGPPPVPPAPDTVSGEPAPGENPSVTVPVPPPSEPTPPPAETAPAAAAPPPTDPNALPPAKKRPSPVKVHFSRIAWLSHNDPAAVDRHERIWTRSTLTGVGVTHFLDPEQRSIYVGADLGAAHWLAFEDMELDFRDIDIGLCGEIGYAFFKGLSFEHSICWSSVTSYRRGADSGFEIDAELGTPLTASFTVNYLK